MTQEFFFFTSLFGADGMVRWFYVGIAEFLVFHPVDTIAKRLMSNKAKVRSSSQKEKREKKEN